jgi:ABC-type transport system involved in multi-copper enzyme maturation permease subunit
MQRLLAIAWLTLKAAFRFRLVAVLAVVLLGGVVLLPLVIKDDGTARGFTQILLTYTLSLITALLGIATLWLACGTLARDVEEAQIQMVAVKPVARWQIWLGKWIGILALDALLLSLSAGAVFFLMQWRARNLPPEQQIILRNEVMVARGSAKEPVPDFKAVVEEELQRRLKANPIAVTDLDFMRKQIGEQLKAGTQLVPADHRREWKLDFGLAKGSLRDQPVYIRTKFNVAQASPSRTYLGEWRIGEFNSPLHYQTNMSLAADTFHEFIVPPNLLSESGVLTINFINRNETPLLFPLEDGMEVLYRESGFALNFVRGVAIIFFWLALMAALGLAAASFLSFPVAAFLSLGVLIIGLSSGTISLVIEQGTVFEVNHETGVADKPALLDYVALPVFRALQKLINMVQGYSPIDSLSSGRSITWGQLALAFTQICLILGGILSAIGMTIFTRRELATAQGNH